MKQHRSHPFLAAMVVLTLTVTGGHDADRHEWPSHVGLAFSDHPEFPFCASTLIAPDVLLTAAHCLRGLDPAMLNGTAPLHIVAVAGLYDRAALDADVQIVPLAQVMPHPLAQEYSNTWDAALVRLAQPLQSTAAVRVAHLAELTATVGTPATLIGWGITDPSQCVARGTLAQVLQEAEMAMNLTYDSQLIFYAPPASACKGDSGGGMMVREAGEWRVISIVSNSTGYDAGTQSVSSIRPWLCETMPDVRGCRVLPQHLMLPMVAH